MGYGKMHNETEFKAMGVLVLSDNEDAAHAIGNRVPMNGPLSNSAPVLASPMGQACHIDKNGKHGLHDTHVDPSTCSLGSAVEWVALSFTDVMVSRAMDLS